MGKVILDSDSVSKVSKGMDTLSSNVETILVVPILIFLVQKMR